MDVVGRVLSIFYVALMGGALISIVGMMFETIRRRPDPWMRGKHVSRPLIRRIGSFRAHTARGLLSFGAVGLYLAVGQIPGRVLFAVLAVWSIDDYLTGREGPRKKRLRNWAKAKLRKLKPVRLRPAERWKPAPVPA